MNRPAIALATICGAAILSGCNSTGFPDYIGRVQPKPGETASLSDPSQWTLSYEGEAGSICTTILEGSLLRPGDDIYYWQNASLSLDGQEITLLRPSHQPVDLEAVLLDESKIAATEQLDLDEDGTIDETSIEYEVIARGIDSDTLCWRVDLEPGMHEATLTVWTSTDEEYTYSWRFEVVE